MAHSERDYRPAWNDLCHRIFETKLWLLRECISRNQRLVSILIKRHRAFLENSNRGIVWRKCHPAIPTAKYAAKMVNFIAASLPPQQKRQLIAEPRASKGIMPPDLLGRLQQKCIRRHQRRKAFALQ